MSQRKALAIINFHFTECRQDVHSKRSVKQLEKAIALIKGENK
jgi:hypothetical protein